MRIGGLDSGFRGLMGFLDSVYLILRPGVWGAFWGGVFSDGV